MNESNHSGSFLEDMIEAEFRKRGIAVIPHSEEKGNSDLFSPNRLVKGAPYISLYGCTSRSEFLYVHRNSPLVRIECRFQETAGSVDEKFPYLLQNARESMPEPAVWLVVEGGGARDQAVEWLRRGAKAATHKTICVLTLLEAKKAIKPLVEHGSAAVA